RRDDGENSAENPRAPRHRGSYPDAGGGIRGHHLPHRNQEEHDRVQQRDDGAFAVGENGKSAHAFITVLEVGTGGCDPRHAKLKFAGSWLYCSGKGRERSLPGLPKPRANWAPSAPLARWGSRRECPLTNLSLH